MEIEGFGYQFKEHRDSDSDEQTNNQCYNSSYLPGYNTTHQINDSQQQYQCGTSYPSINSQKSLLDSSGQSSSLMDQFQNIYNNCIDLQFDGDDDYHKREGIVGIQQCIGHGLIGLERMKLWTGMTLMSDGTLRLCAALGSLSFNFQQQVVNVVEDKKSIGVVDLHFAKNYAIQEYSLEDALSFMMRSSGNKFKSVEEELTRLYSQLVSVRKMLKSLEITEKELEFKDTQFEHHVNCCYEYLKNTYCKNPETQAAQMYWYSLGRFNYRENDVEVLRTGFSKSYLELLGLDQSSLSSIYLRKQQIDLIKDQQGILEQTLTGIHFKCQHMDSDEQVVKITTFDGFPLTLLQRKKQVRCSNIPPNTYTKTNDFFFSVVEMDVDLDELQRLIEYRQKILLNPENLTIEEYAQKELSYLFEDVEYSIHSQVFMEKFYKENLLKIREIEQQIQRLRNLKQPCGYKLIHKQPSKYYSRSTA